MELNYEYYIEEMRREVAKEMKFILENDGPEPLQRKIDQIISGSTNKSDSISASIQREVEEKSRDLARVKNNNEEANVIPSDGHFEAQNKEQEIFSLIIST